MAARSRSRRLRRLRRRIRDYREDPRAAIREDPRQFVLVVAGVLFVLGVLLFTWESFRAYGALNDANDRVDVLQESIVNGDVDAARTALERLDESTSRARNNTNGPRWWLAAQVPILGRNVDAVRVVARELDQISDDVLPGIVDVADKVQLETFRPKDGRIDMEAVADAAPSIETADDIISAGNREVSAVDVDDLLGPLREPMGQAQERFKSTATAASAANDATKLIPTMLADDGEKRTYLLVILNNAEVRALGGMPGSVAEITAEDGRVEMEEQGGTLDIRSLAKPALELTEEEEILYSNYVARDMRQAGAVPDFPRAAELLAGIVGKRWKQEYDGVVAVDPVAMGYVLRGIGTVDVGDGVTIDSTNAVSTLLNGVYLRYPQDQLKQDEVFENAARRIFDAVTGGQGNSVAVVRALVQGVSERRIMVWSRDDSEQQRIESGGLANALVSSGRRPNVGVFVNDLAGGKMGYYLEMGTRLRSERCFDSDAQELRTTTTLRSNGPAAARGLPLSITGFGPNIRPGNITLGVTVLGPRDGELVSMTVDGQRAPIGGLIDGRPVANVVRELPPGQSSVIITTMRSAASTPGDPQLRTTPGVTPNGDSAGATSCD